MQADQSFLVVHFKVLSDVTPITEMVISNICLLSTHFSSMKNKGKLITMIPLFNSKVPPLNMHLHVNTTTI